MVSDTTAVDQVFSVDFGLRDGSTLEFYDKYSRVWSEGEKAWKPLGFIDYVAEIQSTRRFFLFETSVVWTPSEPEEEWKRSDPTEKERPALVLIRIADISWYRVVLKIEGET